MPSDTNNLKILCLWRQVLNQIKLAQKWDYTFAYDIEIHDYDAIPAARPKQ